MRFLTTIMVMFILISGAWVGGTCMSFSDGGSFSGPSPAYAAPVPATAGSSQNLEAPKNWALRWALFIGVLAAIWLVFYKGVYARLVKHYYYDHADSLFWSLILLYSIGWISFSLYAIFEVWQMWPWAKFISLFISALWLIWFMTIIFRSDVGHRY